MFKELLAQGVEQMGLSLTQWQLEQFARYHQMRSLIHIYVQEKLREAITRIINEGNGGMICILL